MAPCDPVSTTPVLAATLVVVTGKVAFSIPAGTVIVAGTFATAGLVLVKFTLMPPPARRQSGRLAPLPPCLPLPKWALC